MKTVPAILIAAAAAAFAPATPAAAQEAGSELRVALVTMGPGQEVWERFGHNAIMVQDTVRGTNKWYNYGMFSFAQENFILNFIQGRMEYWMEGRNAASDLTGYMNLQRWVRVQYLHLSNAEKVNLKTFLENNDTPRNRFYRYDYYGDNCSTRVRDAIDLVLGGQIRAQTEGRPTGTTFRFHTRRLTTADPIIYTALNIALGPAVDRPIDRQEEMFLPLAISDIFRDLTVVDADGTTHPLVDSERMIYESDRWGVGDAPPSWIPYYLAIGIILALIIAILGYRATKCPYARTGYAIIGTAWALITGVLGTVLAGLWLFTDHTVAYWNENLFLLNPLPLLLAALIPLVALRWEGAAQKAQKIGIAVAALAALGFALQIVPGIDQVNGELYALFLPPMLALGLSVTNLSWWVFDS